MGRPERILVADDDAPIRALLRTILVREGYGLPVEQTLAELRREAGRQFDPDLATLFVEHRSAFGAPVADVAVPAFARGLVAGAAG